MYFIGIVSDCIYRKIICSTPNRKNLFGRKMKTSLNYLSIHLTDVVPRNEYRKLQLLLKLEDSDIRLESQGVENCKKKSAVKHMSGTDKRVASKGHCRQDRHRV